ncbi:hypothetical protein [Halorhodospira halochloris]|uniref:hypothetical protein n=1 Tax=Halorhodospira halochloris TaxID=1052 RepID=UPI001EE92250|nr:hypothetical protein [Halorhodospira halochloris]MCG5549283.1 hypothetical protein [Halorhodospira halochloris]
MIGEGNELKVKRQDDQKLEEIISVTGEILHVGALEGYYIVVSDSYGYLISKDRELIDDRPIHFSIADARAVSDAVIVEQGSGIRHEWSVKRDEIEATRLDDDFIDDVLFYARTDDQEEYHYLYKERWQTADKEIRSIKFLGADDDHAYFLDGGDYSTIGHLMRMDRSAQVSAVEYYPLDEFHDQQGTLSFIKDMPWQQRERFVASLQPEVTDAVVAKVVPKIDQDAPDSITRVIAESIQPGHDSSLHELRENFRSWTPEQRSEMLQARTNQVASPEVLLALVIEDHLVHDDEVKVSEDAERFLAHYERMGSSSQEEIADKLQKHARSIEPQTRWLVTRKSSDSGLFQALSPAVIDYRASKGDLDRIDEWAWEAISYNLDRDEIAKIAERTEIENGKALDVLLLTGDPDIRQGFAESRSTDLAWRDLPRERLGELMTYKGEEETVRQAAMRGYVHRRFGSDAEKEEALEAAEEFAQAYQKAFDSTGRDIARSVISRQRNAIHDDARKHFRDSGPTLLSHAAMTSDEETLHALMISFQALEAAKEPAAEALEEVADYMTPDNPPSRDRSRPTGGGSGGSVKTLEIDYDIRITAYGLGDVKGGNARSYVIESRAGVIGECAGTVEAEWTGSFYDVTCDGYPEIHHIELLGTNTFVVRGDGTEYHEGASDRDRLRAMYGAMREVVR